MEVYNMALGNIVRLWGSINFKSSLKNFEKIFSIASSFESDFNHWWTDHRSAILHDTDKNHESLMISHNRVGFETINPDSIEQSLHKLSNLTSKAVKKIGDNTITRMGVKVVVYADLDLAFEEIRNQMQHICYSKKSISKLLGPNDIYDLGISIYYNFNKMKVMLSTGPMESKQGLLRLTEEGTVDKLFPPVSKSEAISELYKSIPDSFLYFDLDIFEEDDLDLKNWLSFTEKSIGHFKEKYDCFKKLILECV